MNFFDKIFRRFILFVSMFPRNNFLELLFGEYVFNSISGRFNVFSLNLIGWPNIASYREHLMLSWKALFFITWTNRRPSPQWVVEFDCTYIVSLSLLFLFFCSTDPWLWLCLGFPCTNFISTHISLSSVVTEFTHSLSLSICKILGAPNLLKLSSN